MTSLSPDSAAVASAAKRLHEASETGRPCQPVRDLLGTTDIDAAYSVQQRLVSARIDAGGTVTGRKIGLTSPAVQAQLGVDQPDFGVLFDDMDVTHLAEVPSNRLIAPKAEAEIAFRLGADLSDGDLGYEQVRAAIDGATVALEIVDSRIANWDITITDTVADNGSAGLYVLGGRWVSVETFDPREVTMHLYSDGNLVSEGNGAACLGDPVIALAWLARTARDYGQPLLAGQVVLSGALGPMIPTPPGTEVRAELSVLGSLAVSFSKEAS